MPTATKINRWLVQFEVTDTYGTFPGVDYPPFSQEDIRRFIEDGKLDDLVSGLEVGPITVTKQEDQINDQRTPS